MPNVSKLVCLVASLLCAATSLAQAQGGQVAVIRIDPAAEPISRAMEASIASVGLAPDPGYLAEAQRRGMNPAGEQALGTLVPMIGVRLVVLARGMSPTTLEVEFRDGQSGGSLGTIDVPIENGALGWSGRNVLVRETRSRLGMGPAPEAGGADGDGDYEADAEDDEDGADGDPAAGDAEGDEAGVELHLGVGAGVGMRRAEWPSQSGGNEVVDSGAFPALELRAAIDLVTDESFSIGPVFHYQSSFGHEVTEQHVDGAGRPMIIRAHHFEAAVVPTFRLGDDHAMHLSAALGYGVRDLSPEVHHLLTPSYSLSGPFLRVGLRVPLGEDLMVLVIEPELQVIMQVSDDLQDRDVAGSGFGFGGQASLSLALDENHLLGVSYREAHTSMSSNLGGSASDVERFITLRVEREL